MCGLVRDLSSRVLKFLTVSIAAMLTSNSLDTTVPTQDFALRLNSGEVPMVLDNPNPTPAGYGEGAGRGGKSRGRGDRSRGGRGRGRGGRGGATAPDNSALVVGKYPRNKTLCVDTDGGNLCFAYQRPAGCTRPVYGGACSENARSFKHKCAIVKSVNPVVLCLSTDHTAKDCPTRKSAGF